MCPILWDPMDCLTPGFPVHHQPPELAQTHVQWVGDAIQPPHPLSSPSPPAFNLSQHQGLFYEPVLCIRWPKYWSFSFSISPSNQYSGLISFKIWLVGSSRSPRDSQESSLTPQFKSINSKAIQFKINSNFIPEFFFLNHEWILDFIQSSLWIQSLS